MQIAKKRSLNIALIAILLLSLFIPQAALAYTVKGDPDNPTLTIHKFEQEPGAGEGEAGTGLPGQNAEGDPVEGVEFTLTQTHKYNAETDEWEAVTDGKTIKGTTGKNGQVVFTKDTDPGLELGRYEIQETDGPDHIILNPDVFSVDIPMTNREGTELNYDVHIYPKNEIIRGDAELIKVGEAGNPLSGVVFGLYKEDGTKLEELTTDASGKISVEGLSAGKYYFQEFSAPDGYALNTTKIKFEVTKEGGKSVVVWENSNINDSNTVTNYNIPELEKDVEGGDELNVDRDKEYTYNLTIKTPGDIDNYKALGVTDTLDERLEYAGSWAVEGTDPENVTFKQDGQTLIWEVDPTVLTPGQEVKISFTAKIKPDAELIGEETGIPNVADIHFNNGKGSYTKPADPDNPDPYDPYDPEDPDKPTDPENPPTPEEPPTTPPVIVIPTEGGLKVIKVEKGNHDNLLEGAEFKLTTDKEGNNVVNATGTTITVNGQSHEGLLQDLVTKANGEILIEGLTPGTYYLHETKAPTYTDADGNEKPYRLLTKPVVVEVADSTEARDVTVENSKSGWELPTTGGIGTILFTLVGLALMGIALFAYLRRRQTAEQ